MMKFVANGQEFSNVNFARNHAQDVANEEQRDVPYGNGMNGIIVMRLGIKKPEKKVANT